MTKSMRRIGGVSFVMMALFSGSSSVALAQADPAGSIIEQNEQRARELDAASNPPPVRDPVLAAPPAQVQLPPPGGPTITLKSVVFEPSSEFLSPQELDAITAPYTGQKLDFAAISALVQAINDLYAAKGVVTAGAVLPAQTLADGVLRVQLVEGRQGVVSIVGGTRTRDDYLFDRITLARQSGVVDVPAAAKDIAFFNRTNRAQVRLLLQPGAAFGFTDLTLGISEPAPYSIQYFLDNYGVRTTGHVEGGLSYRAYGLAGMDDSLMASLSASAGSFAGSANYEIPVTTSGTRVSLGYSGSKIGVVDGPTEPLDISGSSQVVSLTLSQPIVANTEWALLALASGSYGSSSSRAGEVSLVQTTTTKGSLGFALGYNNETASFNLQPQVVYAGSEDLLASMTRYITVGAVNASGTIRLADNLTLVARGASQYAGDQTLLPADLLFEIGGPSTVRGYPAEGVAGDSGYYVQTELHWGISDNVDLYALTDFGQVFSTFPARTTMNSVGVGMTYTNDRIAFDMVVAAPIRDSVADQQTVAVYTKLTGSIF